MSTNKHLTRAEVEAREDALRAHCNPVSRSTEGPTRTIPSDAPAETIARLSVELAASKAQAERMREALKDLSEWRCGCRGSADECSCLTIIREQALAALASAPDDIAIPRERYDRMVKALGMGRELAHHVSNEERGTDDNATEKIRAVLDAMDAAGKA